MKDAETLCEGAEPYVFISYSHNDSGRVLPLLDAMRKCGYRFWYDADMQAGRQWTDELAASIAKCAVFIPFVSDSYGASEYCMQEIRYAAREKKAITPVFLTDKRSLAGKLNYQLKDWHGFSLQSASPSDFIAWIEKQVIFRPCRDADTVSVSVSADLVTNERPTEASPSFVGRADIMDAIETAFREGVKVVNLYGMGGIGKSEICRKFFRDRTAALVKRVGWLTWRGTLQNTFYAQFRDIKEENAERYWQLSRELVNRAGRDLLLVIDNADDMTEAQAAKLSQLQCRFLVTSRREQESFHRIHAGKLPPEQCRILYRRALSHNHTLTDDSPDDALDEILRLADYHTLAVELLAKTQRAQKLSVAELLTQLQGTGFDLNGEDIEFLYHPEEAPEDADTESPFIEHMSHIFDLSQLRDVRKGAEALRVLQGMSLLSPNTPIPVKTVETWLNLPDLNGLNKAADTGWLEGSIEPDGTWHVSIHPVIAAVVRHTEPPDADYTDAVAGRLRWAMYVGKDIFVTKLPILKHAIALHHVAQLTNLKTKNYAGMLHQMGHLAKEQGDYASALEYHQKALPIIKSVFGENHPNTATTYNSIASVYLTQGKYASALEYYKMALPILESVPGATHPYAATIYTNIASVYREQGEYDRVFEWSLKALHILKSILRSRIHKVNCVNFVDKKSAKIPERSGKTSGRMAQNACEYCFLAQHPTEQLLPTTVLQEHTIIWGTMQMR